MPSLHQLLQLSLVTLASAIPTDKRSNATGIPWGPCEETEVTAWAPSTAITCANLSVPLDYTDSSSTDKLTLQLVRVPAAIQPSQGTIQFNFGGPGAAARPALAVLDTMWRNITGGVYDLVAFDPRGTGNTIPFSCARTEVEATSFLDLFGAINASDTGLGRAWAAGLVEAQKCAAYNNVTGSMINTAFVARDLMSVVDALGEDGMLRYYGYSYGTILGATVAAMFPERIDKLVLDGVQNPHQYYHAFADYQEGTQTDKVLSALFSLCVEAGPGACPLAALNMTATELEDEYWNLVESLRELPAVVNGQIVGYAEIKKYVADLLYDNAGWANFTAVLTTIFSEPENTTQALEAIIPQTASLLSELVLLEPLVGIHCGDRTARTNDFNKFVPVYQELTEISAVAGDIIAPKEAICAQWLIEPKERYNGDFKAQTANPILFVANDGDPYTPVVSAYNASSGFAGSVVLELINAYGHTSANVPSSCALKHISQYWLDGTLPPKGTKCEVEAKPYTEVTWADIFAKVAGNDTASASNFTRAV